MPFWLPTYRRPPAIVGCAHAEVVSGNPNAHLRRSRGTCVGGQPGLLRRLEMCVVDGRASPARSTSGRGGLGERLGRPRRARRSSDRAARSGARSFRPVSHSAIARRLSPLSASPWYCIEPAVSASMIACGDRPRMRLGDGARGSSPLWQPLQYSRTLPRRGRGGPAGCCASRPREEAGQKEGGEGGRCRETENDGGSACSYAAPAPRKARCSSDLGSIVAVRGNLPPFRRTSSPLRPSRSVRRRLTWNRD